MSELPSILDREKELLQIEMETRHAKVLELYSKGLTQTEISQQLGLSQSTISKDLKKIRRQAKKKVKDDILDDEWEFARYLAGTDSAIKGMWEIAQDKEVSAKSRIEALAHIMEFYESRSTGAMLSSKYFTRKEEDEMYGR
ncbi:MAG TPA: LuxR C-terminal-related transcriptional regulator [Nitrososphaera sp.]|jgi:predicted transcriptional regulator|nr:LuxR C-terminal-related transcriptional regulator [Nitrososphaera sp.]